MAHVHVRDACGSSDINSGSFAQLVNFLLGAYSGSGMQTPRPDPGVRTGELDSHHREGGEGPGVSCFPNVPAPVLRRNV